MESNSLAGTIESQAPSPTGARIDPPQATDRQGRAFDPTLHATQPDGSPELSSSGRLKGRPGRPRRGREGAGVGGPSLLPPAPMAGLEDDPAASAAAVTVASLLGLAAMFGGEHWKASKEEHLGMLSAWTNYYRIRGVVELPPEVMLIVAMGAFAMSNELRRKDLKRLPEALGLARFNRRNNGLGKDGMRTGPDPGVSAA